MNEAAETAVEKLDTLITESQSQSPAARAFELNQPIFNVGFPVSWPPLGEITVKHRLRRPEPVEEADYKKKIVAEERVLGNGRIVDERTKVAPAMIWLWSRLGMAIKDYPDLAAQAGADGWVELTDDLKGQMRTAHKELAIRHLFECDVQILQDESVTTFSGGQWAVLLRLGSRDSCYASIKLKFNEWNERQKDSFEGSQSIGGSKLEGKSRRNTAAVNQRAYTSLFDALLIEVSADPAAGLHDVITVDGEAFSSLNRSKFLAAFLGEWKVDVIAALAQEWRGK